MDDIEFLERAHTNPDDNQQDFLDALTGRPDREKIVNELRHLDQQLLALSASLSVCPQLRNKLLKPARPSMVKRSAYALAASLVLAVGFVVSILPYRPSAAELALHDAMIEHLNHEEPRYQDAAPISWNEVEEVLTAAGIRLSAPEGESALIVTFANLCRLGGSQRAVHLVTLGEEGPVSVILMRSTPVGGNMEVQDDRFKGRILPASDGNMAVIGEKNEKMEQLESLIANSVQWSI